MVSKNKDGEVTVPSHFYLSKKAVGIVNKTWFERTEKDFPRRVFRSEIVEEAIINFGKKSDRMT